MYKTANIKKLRPVFLDGHCRVDYPHFGVVKFDDKDGEGGIPRTNR